jgi:hypothetical protein
MGLGIVVRDHDGSPQCAVKLPARFVQKYFIFLSSTYSVIMQFSIQLEILLLQKKTQTKNKFLNRLL